MIPATIEPDVDTLVRHHHSEDRRISRSIGLDPTVRRTRPKKVERVGSGRKSSDDNDQDHNDQHPP